MKRSFTNAAFTAVIFMLGLGLGAGFRTEGKIEGWSAHDECSGAGCEKAALSARYRMLVCRYMGIRGTVEVRYLAEGWQGDLDIPADLTESGKAFPPELPPLYELDEKQRAKIRAGDAEQACPYFTPVLRTDESHWQGAPIETIR